MALDPNIALGVRGIELPNQLAQYGMLSQIQNAQQANQLHQMQMAEYERARAEEEGTRNFLGKANLTDPSVRSQLLTNFGKSGRDVYKNITEAEKAQSEEAARRAKLMQDTQAMYQNMSGQIGSKQDATMFLQRMLNDPAMKDAPITKIPLMEQVKRIPDDPKGLDNWIKQFSLGATKYITENKPHFVNQDTGAGGRTLSAPGLGGDFSVVPGSEFTKTMTFADRNAAARLKFEKDKFEWEKANPGYEIREDADGNTVGVNKRTLQAFPVMIGGGAAPAAAPMASGAGMPGPRVAQPNAVVPAIPGMTSVLDQAAPAAAPAVAPAAGGPRQLVGKGTALTESQGNATAFGMRMKEANSILTPLEKSGFKNTGLISNAVGGAVGIVPLIGDKLEGMTGSVFNVLPQIMGGLSPEQQQVAQARINFITAVLRKESGASIQPSEFSMEEKKYFPKPGDDASAIAQKQKARDLAIKSMGIQAGPGAKHIEQYVPSGATGAPTVSNW